jgi:perosamine synthetase
MASVALFHARHDFDACALLRPVFDSGQLAGGPVVTALEDAVSAMCQSRPVVAVSDMTQALALALTLAGVQAGDDVLTLSLNCMASNSAITHVGANAVWVDMVPSHARMDLDDLRRAITPNSKALVVYHLAGYPAQMDEAVAFCMAHGLALIEDANNAWLAADCHCRAWMPTDFLYFSVFSLYPNRQVNGIDGALLVCPSPALAQRARRLCRYGIDGARFRLPDGEIDPNYDITERGVNIALNSVHAALALAHLSSLAERVALARRNALRLAAVCGEHPHLSAVRWSGDRVPAFWVFLVLTPHRNALALHLKQQGIASSRLHFPNHRYSVFGPSARTLPGTDQLQDQLLALPCGAWLSESDVAQVVDVLQQFSAD